MCQTDDFNGQREHIELVDAARASRRFFLLMGLGALAGCATGAQVSDLPRPVWPSASSGPQANPEPMPPPIDGVMARSRWAGGKPDVSQMNQMLPVRYVTVHHDGMRPFTRTDERSTIDRIEEIRRGHRARGWGDIGYHYVVDRSGRVWEARSLSFQGAHVKDRNENNLGIVCLGNFDEQTPSPQQLAALNRHVSLLMRRYKVSSRSVYTHQEWPGAKTACPGRSLEAYMRTVRSNGQLG